MTPDDRPLLRELRCPSCGGAGAYRGATSCATCDQALVSMPVDVPVGPPEPAFVYRRSVAVALAIAAVVFPLVPVPLLGGPVGFLVKVSVSGALLKILRDYRETMLS